MDFIEDDDERELAEELEVGNTAAVQLVEHMERMGAGAISIPITTDHRCYHVEVRSTL